MKKLTFLLFCLIILHKSYSQHFLDKTYQEIYNTVVNDYKVIPISKTQNNKVILTWEVKIPYQSFRYSVYFNTSTENFSLASMSTNEVATLNKTIQYFNENYVIVTKNNWHYYVNGKTIEVNLVYFGNGNDYTFYFDYFK